MSNVKRRIIHMLLCALIAFWATSPNAGVFEDDLKRCMAEKATHEDKVALMRWMVIAFSHHDGVRDLVAIAPGASDLTAKGYADVMNRIILVDCRDFVSKALRMEGEQSLLAASRFFGLTAVREIFQNPAVANELNRVESYIDEDAWGKLAE